MSVCFSHAPWSTAYNREESPAVLTFQEHSSVHLVLSCVSQKSWELSVPSFCSVRVKSYTLHCPRATLLILLLLFPTTLLTAFHTYERNTTYFYLLQLFKTKHYFINIIWHTFFTWTYFKIKSYTSNCFLNKTLNTWLCHVVYSIPQSVCVCVCVCVTFSL